MWLKEKRRCRNGTSRSCQRCYLVKVEEGCQEEAQREKNGSQKRAERKKKTRSEIAQEVVAGIKEEASAQERCQVDRTENCWAKGHAKLRLLTNRKRRRGGRERLARGGPDASTVG